jgi:hypothetical protein
MKRILFVQVSFSLMAICAHAQIPTISSFAPNSTAVGNTISITGTNFSNIPSQNIVYFGGIKATIASASTTSISVYVPTGASNKPISVTVNGLTAFSAASFFPTFVGGEIISSTFSASTQHATAAGPHNIAFGDFDGDAKLDIVVTNDNASSLSAFRNTSSIGAVSFGNKIDFTTLQSPFGLAVGDLNSDGKLDVVVVNNHVTAQKISVFENVSNPGNLFFAPKLDYIIGNGGQNVAIADFDADGKPDVAVTNKISNNFSVLKNTGSGGSITLNAKIDFATGASPVDIAANDFDGDGKMDIVVTNEGANTISIFKNTTVGPNISFAAKIDFATGTMPRGIAVGDVTGDGKADIAVANAGVDNTISIFKNISNGSIQLDAKTDIALASNAMASALSIVDLNGDAKADIVVESIGNNKLSVFKNIANSNTISFAARVDYNTQAAGASNIIAADLDGDNKPDLLKSNNSPANNFSVFRNQGVVTAINNVTVDKSLFNIYPNPSPALVNIQFQKNYSHKNHSLQLQDFNGQVLLTQKIKAQKEQLDLTSFANGIYTINLLDEKNNRLFAQKIIKQ